MMRRLAILVLLALLPWMVAAQAPEPPRANVAAYDDEDGIVRLAYRESPYYLELSGRWQQRETDSSVVYGRTLTAEKVWREYHTYLNVRCGRACRVYVNGRVAGYGDDSRHWNEFRLDELLRYGKDNLLEIEALKHPEGAKLEDSAIAVGLNGEPYILFKTEPNIADMTLVADYDVATTTGTLSLDVAVENERGKGRYYVEVELWDPQGHRFDRMGRWIIFDKRHNETVDISRSWNGVAAWNAEQPQLYTAVVRLRDEKMELVEVTGCRFGFRSVSVRDGVLTVNGKPVTLKGVAYGLPHTEGYAARERMRRDLETMKRYNINAIHTTHFSPMDEHFYELCDELGFYVVADANLLPLSTQAEVVATEADYIPMFERRVENLYGKYKNHSSIVAWSAGNSRDNGVCMTAAYKRLKALEQHRPVLMACAEHGENTDMVVMVSPDAKNLAQTTAKGGERPYVIFSMAGRDNFGRLEALWKTVEERRQVQGGFVDVWPMSDVMLSDLSHLYSPLEVTLSKLSPDEAEFVIYNRNDFASFGGYGLDYVIYTDRRTNIVAGDLPVAAAGGASDKVSLRVPQLNLAPGEEVFVRFTLTERPRGGARARTVGSVVFPLPQQSTAQNHFVNDGPALQDTTVADATVGEMRFVGHDDWSVRRLDAVERRVDSQTLLRDELLQYTTPDGEAVCDVRRTTVVYSTGDVVVEYALSPQRSRRAGLQPAVSVAAKGDSMMWFGLDREVVLPERNSGIVGTYSRKASNVTLRGARWCALGGDGRGVAARVVGRRFSFATGPDGITLMPEYDSVIRLHIKHYTGAMPVESMTMTMPDAAGSIAAPPAIRASATRFVEPMSVTLESQTSGDIRYTLDGSDPTPESALYTGPFTIGTTTVVKARLFPTDMPPSFCSTRRFNYDYIVGTTFSRKPNTPYNRGADSLLFDGLTGSTDDFSSGWVGFSGDGVETTVQLAQPLDVDTVVLRYAHSPATWAFAPRSVCVTFGGGDSVRCQLPFDPTSEAENEVRIVELRVPVGRSGVTTFTVKPECIGRIPAWHRGKGLKPWLMMDEMIVVEAVKHNAKEQ